MICKVSSNQNHSMKFCIFNSKRKKPLRAVNKFHVGSKADVF